MLLPLLLRQVRRPSIERLLGVLFALLLAAWFLVLLLQPSAVGRGGR